MQMELRGLIVFLVFGVGLVGLMLSVSGCQVNQSDQVQPANAVPIEIWRK